MGVPPLVRSVTELVGRKLHLPHQVSQEGPAATAGPSRDPRNRSAARTLMRPTLSPRPCGWLPTLLRPQSVRSLPSLHSRRKLHRAGRYNQRRLRSQPVQVYLDIRPRRVRGVTPSAHRLDQLDVAGLVI